MTKTAEYEMVRRPADKPAEERTTSLQPTYEDSVPPDDGQDWELED